jgi:hypothetical protein
MKAKTVAQNAATAAYLAVLAQDGHVPAQDRKKKKRRPKKDTRF